MSGKLKVDELYSDTGTISLTNGTRLDLSNSSKSILIPAGTTAESGSPSNSAVRYDRTQKSLSLKKPFHWSIPKKETDTSLLPQGYVRDGILFYLDSGYRNSYPGYGSTWWDLSGAGNHAEIQNSPSYNINTTGNTGGDINHGYWTMNYSSNRFIVPSLEYFRYDAGITAGFWWYNGGGTGYYRGIMTNGINGSRQGSFDWRIGREDYYGGSNNGTNLDFYVKTDGGSIRPTILATANEWHYYVGTYDNRLLRMYKDGVLWKELVHPNPGPLSIFGGDGTGVIIGHSPGTSEYMDGRFGIAELYNRALTEDEVRRNYDANKFRFPDSIPPDLRLSGLRL